MKFCSLLYLFLASGESKGHWSDKLTAYNLHDAFHLCLQGMLSSESNLIFPLMEYRCESMMSLAWHAKQGGTNNHKNDFKHIGN
ncbi:Oidioi.mRNA.OKI2018_I69.chr2.g4240.t1.cds [Oikopleura dioica]|uniref:Oidioi.mRNA.OKI2018_I69.chr2.g4240.t1.cds n=1 Tax=Oikopleura dioica TaxID=34765 RepID=A0ABN7SWC4_OIKDI|nr:Oidioi.mRNA.OKI2018_I69.chr2.g4240.t1.cds [Oikopleura dioica]